MRFLCLVFWLLIAGIAYSSNKEISFLDQETINLYIAIENGDKKTTEKLLRGLLSQRADSLHNDMTPLMYAANLGKDEVVSTLLGIHGLDIDRQNSAGLTALHIACAKGHKKVVFTLLKANIEANIKDKSGKTPFLCAILGKNFALAKEMVQYKKVDINAQDKEGRTPLINAIILGNTELADILAKDQRSNLDIVDNQGRSAFFWALNNGSPIAGHLQEVVGNYSKDNSGHSPLTIAAESGNLQIVGSLLKRKAPVNELGPGGKNPIYLAAANNHPKVVNLLIHNKGDVNGSCIPLMAAVANVNSEMVSLLVNKGAKFDCKLIKKSIEKNNVPAVKLLLNMFISELTILQKVEVLEWAVHKNLNSIQKILWVDASNNPQKSNTLRLPIMKQPKDLGNTLLIGTSKIGNILAVDTLIFYGADVEQTDDNRDTPLAWATYKNRIQVVRTLLQAGADINNGNNFKETPLMCASYKGNEKIVEILLANGANANLKRSSGKTAWQLASNKKIKKMLKHAERSQLHWAAAYGKIQLMNKILQNGTSIDLKDKNNVTPLMVAVMENQKDSIKFLLENGADKSIVSNLGTALYIAIKEANYELVEILLEPDYNFKQEVKFATTDDNYTIIKHIIKNFNLSMEQRRELLLLNIKKEEVVKELMQDIKTNEQNLKLQKNEDEDTELVLAAYEGRLLAIKALVSYGYDIHQTGQHKGTALFWAAERGKLKAVEMLLEYGSKIDASNNAGTSPLMIAAIRKHPEVVKLLLEHKADISKENNEGKTAWELTYDTKTLDLLEQNERFEFKLNTENLKKALSKDRVQYIEHLLASNYPLDRDKLLEITLWASKHGKKEILESINHRLNDTKIPPGKINLPIVDESHALIEAAKSNDMLAMETLLKCGADVNQSIADGKTALFWANEDAIDALMTKGADLNVVDSDKCTPLMQAIKKDKTNEVLKLLEHGANANEEYITRVTNIEIFEVLVKHPNTVLSPEIALEILHKASKEKIIGISESLLTHIKFFKIPNFVILDTHYAKVMHILESNSQNWKTCLDIFIELDINLDKGYETGFNPLFLATKQNDVKKIDLLLRSGVDINTKYNRKTILDFAHRRKKVEALNFLVNCFDIKLTKKKCIELVKWATINNYKTLVKSLIYKTQKVKNYFWTVQGYSKLDRSFLLSKNDLSKLVKKFPKKKAYFHRTDETPEENEFEMQEL